MLAACTVACAGSTAEADGPGQATTRPGATTAPGELAWIESLDDAYKDALREQRPIFVVVGAVWCGPCHRLKEEMAKPVARERLAKWTLVYVDADRSPDVARQLAADTLPALRVLTPAGATVASSAGLMLADELVAWLDAGAAAAQAAMPLAEEFTGIGPPDGATTAKLIDALRSPQPALHEAAVRRLTPHPRAAAVAVVEAFVNGKLEQRLAMTDLLTEWHAPVADLDPWRPETVTTARLEALRRWAEQQHAAVPGPTTRASATTQ